MVLVTGLDIADLSESPGTGRPRQPANLGTLRPPRWAARAQPTTPCTSGTAAWSRTPQPDRGGPQRQTCCSVEGPSTPATPARRRGHSRPAMAGTASVLSDLDVQARGGDAAPSTLKLRAAASAAARAAESPGPWSPRHRGPVRLAVPTCQALARRRPRHRGRRGPGHARASPHSAATTPHWTTTGAAPCRGRHVARGHGDRRRLPRPRDLDHPGISGDHR